MSRKVPLIIAALILIAAAVVIAAARMWPSSTENEGIRPTNSITTGMQVGAQIGALPPGEIVTEAVESGVLRQGGVATNPTPGKTAIDFQAILEPGVKVAPASDMTPQGCGFVVLVPNKDAGYRIKDNLIANQSDSITYIMWDRAYYSSVSDWKGVPLDDRGSEIQNFTGHLHVNQC